MKSKHKANKLPPCGNPDCCVSTFIDEITLTFGTGILDDHGCWEFPCEVCENEHLNYLDERYVEPS